MSGISLEQFETQVKDVQSAYNAKARELSDLQNKFKVLVNSIEVQTQLPDDFDAPEYDDLEAKREEEISEIQDTVADLAYDFDLEWDGSFEEGSNSFWQPSNC